MGELPRTLIVAVFSLGVGFLLSQLSAKGERDFQERQRRRERQEEVAVAFQRAALRAGRNVPTGVVARRIALPGIDRGHQEMREEWGAAEPFLQRDKAVFLAYRVLDVLLLMAAGDCQTDQEETENFYALGRAFCDLQNALSAFVHGENPPTPELPSPETLIQLASPSGRNVGLEGVNRYLASDRH